MSDYFVINVTNNGGYVARFSVTYTENGKQLTTDSGDFTAGVMKSIRIPGKATAILLKVEDAVFIASWRTIFTKQWASAPGEQVCFKVSGTTLDPHWVEEKC